MKYISLTCMKKHAKVVKLGVFTGTGWPTKLSGFMPPKAWHPQRPPPPPLQRATCPPPRDDDGASSPEVLGRARRGSPSLSTPSRCSS